METTELNNHLYCKGTLSRDLQTEEAKPVALRGSEQVAESNKK